MILICGGLADSVTELVCSRLESCGYAYRLLDLGRYPTGYDVTWHWSDGVPTGAISTPDWKLDLSEISGIYVRYLGPEGRIGASDLAKDAVTALYSEYDTGLMALFESLPCTVVNRLGNGMSNASKPYQALLVSECGLRAPDTLVTSDPAEAQRFFDECGGDVIYKSLSGVRSIVRRVEAAQLSRLPLLRHGAAQFQPFIPGDNVRVHTVGEQLFATRVRCTSVDYRYASREGQEVTMEPTELPPEVAASCLRLARELNLLMTGIDLKQTPAGDYYCFEVNPCPGFLYYEKYSGQPISLALAELLRRGSVLEQATQRSTPHG
jgi:glutathione synthase/RimK-type ligase-like ATP-grasp enzyme